MGNALKGKNGSKKLNNSGSNHKYKVFLVKLGQILQKKSSEEEGKRGITKNVFKKYICKASETAAIALFEYFLIEEGLWSYNDGNSDKSVETSDNKVLPKEKFIKQATILLNCHNEIQQLEYYIKVFARGREELTYENFFDLVGASYEIAQFAHHTSVLPDDLLAALSKAVMHGKDRTLCKYVQNWCFENCPRMVMWLHRYLSHTLAVGYSTIPKNQETQEDDDETPVLDSPNKSLCASLHPALLWMLSCSLPSSFTKENTPSSNNLKESSNPRQVLQHLMMKHTPSHWIPLYSSDDHGKHIDGFRDYVFDYHGPTLLFMTTDDQCLFCVACDEQWRDSKHFFGSLDSMCMQLLPEYKIIERGQNLIYFNVNSEGFPRGFQIGTDHQRRVLTIDLGLKNVEYKLIPLKLKSLEVWGCGTSQTKDKQLEFKRRPSRNNTEVDPKNKSTNWKDNPDRHLLEMAGTRSNFDGY